MSTSQGGAIVHVFTADLLGSWIELKRDSARQIALRPHPYEFYLYSDV